MRMCSLGSDRSILIDLSEAVDPALARFVTLLTLGYSSWTAERRTSSGEEEGMYRTTTDAPFAEDVGLLSGKHWDSEPKMVGFIVVSREFSESTLGASSSKLPLLVTFPTEICGRASGQLSATNCLRCNGSEN